MYVSKHYKSGEEVDQRLLQGYYDDAVGAGFVGTLQEFWKLVLSISNKVDKKEGYGLSKNDFTDELKAKLEELSENAVTKVSQLENDLKFQTEDDVKQAIEDLIDGSGAALDTLKELADALNNDPNFATNLINDLTQVKNDLQSEINRATARENALEDQIKNLKIDLQNTITEMVSQLNSTITEIKGQLKTIQSDIKDVQTSILEQKSELQQAINDAKSEVSQQVVAEKDRAIEAENGIKKSVTDLESKHDKEILELRSGITDGKAYTDQEVLKAKTELQSSIDKEISDRQIADEQVKSDLLAQIQNAKAEIKATTDSLAQALAAETSDRTLGDTNLSNSISQEQQARINEDTALGHRIDDLSDRVTREVDKLNQNIQDTVDQIDSQLNNKVDKVDGYGLSENDFTDELKAKLESIEEGAKVITKVSELENDLGYQTEAQVNEAIEKIIGSAPEVLDTLEELAKALGDDPNFATTVTQRIAAITEQLNEEVEFRASEDTRIQTDLQSKIDAESTARSGKDTELQEDIESEATTRAEADKTLQSNIDKAVETLNGTINTVQTALTAADTALSQRIDAQDARINQNVENIQHNLELIQALQTRVDEFKSNMDTVVKQYQELIEKVANLDKKLTQEISDRVEEDQAIRDEINARIDQEVAALQAKDSELQDNIDAEEAARIAGDEQLQKNIDAVSKSLEDFKTNDWAQHIENYEDLKEAHETLDSNYKSFKQEVTKSLTLQIL